MQQQSVTLSNLPQPKYTRMQIIAYLAQLFMLLLIVVYVILSPSLFSSIAVLFLLLLIAANIVTIYKTHDNKPKQQQIISSNDTNLTPYPITKTICLTFATINFLTLIFKLSFYFTSQYQHLTPQQRKFYQIQDLADILLPLIIVPFAVLSSCVSLRPKPLVSFRNPIPEKITTPAYFLLGGLCILVQVWTQSIIGLVYFVLSLMIFTIRKHDFNNRLYKAVVNFILFQAIIAIPCSFLVSTQYFQGFWFEKYYQTIGVDGVLGFSSNLKAAGHLLTQLMLFFYCCLLHRLFQYQRINNIATQKLDQYSMQFNEIFGEHLQNIQNLPGIETSPRKTMRESLLMRKRPQSTFGNVRLTGHQYELRQLYRANDSSRRITLPQPETNRPWKSAVHTKQHKETQGKEEKQQQKQHQIIEKTQQKDEDQLKQKQSPLNKPRTKKSTLKKPSSTPSHSSHRHKHPSDKDNPSQTRQTLHHILDTILKALNQIIAFLNSSDFTLRVAQLLSIILIQRYNNVYSFVLLVWLAMIASVQNLKFVYLATAIVMLPLQIVNYLLMFAYNVPDFVFDDIDHKSIWGFQLMYTYWLDVILFNLFLYYIIIFVSAASKETRSSLYSRTFTTKRQTEQPSNWTLFWAFVFRYTYLFTIFGMFFLGFSSITIIYLGYVVLFFLFFTFGQNLTLETKKKKRRLYSGIQRDQERNLMRGPQRQCNKYQKVYVVTTLSRKFWFVIVYYTLVVIVLKYIYFLFFQDKAQEVLAPIGINQTYQWAFNFSLTSVCKSNTTPFFLIFILAEMQIIIHRSKTYLNYSFSLIASSSEVNMKNEKQAKVKESRRQRLKRVGQQVLCFCLEFYYQGLYYISGIIILACSYSWNIVQLPLVILTCFGLLNKFNKKVLVGIICIDLVFIFGTYIFRFLNYEAVGDMFGGDVMTVLRKIALFCGFNLKQEESLYQIIALNVVIVYFAVQSYRLCNKLAQPPTSPPASPHPRPSYLTSQLRPRHLPQTQYQPTVIDSQFQDKQFATQYQQGVIQATRTYYTTDMLKNYPWMRYLSKALSFVIVDAVSVVVLVCCLYFRLAVSMFCYLLLYLVFYYFLFDRIGRYMMRVGYIGRIEAYLKEYNENQRLLQQRQPTEKVQFRRDTIEELKSFAAQAFSDILAMKYSWKKSLWIYSAVFSTVCLVLTYAAQFLVSDFFVQQVQTDSTNLMEDILFVLGFSVTQQVSFLRQVYFYYLMIVINVVEKLLIGFYQRQKQEKEVKKSIIKEYKSIIREETNLQYLVNEPTITKDFIVEVQFVQDGQLHTNNNQSQLQQQYPVPQLYQKQLISTTNLLIYFQYKSVQVKLNFIYALLSAMVRVYLWLMLINVYQRSSFSAFLYLIALMYFWFRKIEFTVVKDINKAAIIIFLIQYLMLLLDIQSNTSPLPLPNDYNLSILQRYITDPEWLQFLVIGQNSTQTGIVFVSFFINSIIIFVTEIYFSCLQAINSLCLKLTQSLWQRYEYIYLTILKTSIKQKLDLNYERYKPWSYRMLEFTFENVIVNSHVLVSVLVVIMLSGQHNYISLVLLVVMFGYMYMARYTKYGNQNKIYQYTQLFFMGFRLVLFVFIVVEVVLGIPALDKISDQIPNSIGLEIQLTQIFMVLFIQLWLDCIQSQSFIKVKNQGLIKNHQKQTVRLQCLAYQSNNSFVKSLVKTFKQIMTFQLNIKEAHLIIKEWENNFKVEQLQARLQGDELLEKQLAESQDEDEKEVSPQLKAFRHQIRRQYLQKDSSQESSYREMFQHQIDLYTSASLSFSYFEMMKYILKNNRTLMKRILNKERILIDVWDYILEDYDKLQEQIEKCSQEVRRVGQLIVDTSGEDFEDDQDMTGLAYLRFLIQQQYGGDNNNIQTTSTNMHPQPLTNTLQHPNLRQPQANLYTVHTPSKLNLIINTAPQQKPLSKKLWFFCLSNFTYFLLFKIFIYYTINPCLLSLPLVVYVFGYYIIADRKYNNLLIVYLGVVIVLGELFQLQFLDTSEWTAFFFYLNEDGSYNFAIGFLFFLFVLVLIDEEIKKYQGLNRKTHLEAENFQTAYLRILINEDNHSPIYLWRMFIQDQQEYEMQSNPIFQAEDKIFQRPQSITQPTPYSFFDIFYRNKPGIDLYPHIASVQIFLTIYLIFLYPLMTLQDQSDLSSSLKYFTFSANMIIAILAHVLVIVIQRRITLLSSSNPHKQLIKYLFTQLIFILFLIFIYYWASQTPPLQYQPQPALVAFSFFYFFYFLFSGLQVKYGYKKFKKINSFMIKRNMFSYVFVLVFVAIPFLYEIKCIMDWTFLKTSLQLFDWFKLFSVYVSSFKAKIQQIGTLETKLGVRVDWTGKIIGWIGFTLLLLIIFGPMILFSGLNPTAQPNLVNGGSFQLGIHVINGNQFTLYSTSHFAAPPLTVDWDTFNALGFRQVPQLKGLTANDLSRQFQNISFQTYSDNFWAISSPNYAFLKSAFNLSTYQMLTNQTNITYQYRLTISYLLNRQVSQTTASITNFQFPTTNASLPLNIVRQLNDTFHTCNTTTTIPGMYNSLIRLITSGSTFKPTPIFFQDSSGNQRYLQNITLKMTCVKPDATQNLNTNDIYWEVSIQNTTSGIQMFVFADLYQSLLGGLSFTAIYTSVILVVAGFIRGFLAGNLPLIPYEMNAKPEKILQICEAIGIHRERNQFKEEFLMYYELIDIIRSPQIIRKLGASYTNLIARSHRIRRYKQLTNEQKQKKKNI